ncbi:hypothetical protein K435DRAFT_796070 [Dendrothele bispora CBS 962.96]|uniref:NAD(P)-binding protein n=1 Tax=Dendrothele bispora (strain CBS 962.96) TaxID=1314807 RepID=A0A4S8M6P9_DENBC|nr:hypothetical protein K435DRAFT_796070 [Dendrothele bispora CBS 962.96]
MSQVKLTLRPPPNIDFVHGQSRSSDWIKKEGKEPGNGEVLWHELDLVDPRKAKASAEKFMEKEERLDILINKAGLIADRGKESMNKLDTMAVNYLGTYVFTQTSASANRARCLRCSAGSTEVALESNIKEPEEDRVPKAPPLFNPRCLKVSFPPAPSPSSSSLSGSLIAPVRLGNNSDPKSMMKTQEYSIIFMEALGKLWVAANECWIWLKVLMSDKAEMPQVLDGGGNGDGADS